MQHYGMNKRGNMQSLEIAQDLKKDEKRDVKHDNRELYHSSLTSVS
jgi:hypothetical protein